MRDKEVLEIYSSKAVSLTNVARDIAYEAEQKGYIVRLHNTLPIPYYVKEKADKVVFVMTGSPTIAGAWIAAARDIWVGGKGIPTVFYVTVEGPLKKTCVRNWMRDAAPYIAVSKYVKEKLEDSGFKVYGYVYHGVHPEQVKVAEEIARKKSREFKDKLGAEVVFLAILSDHPRKGLDALLKAFSIVREERKGAKLVLLTDAKVKPMDGIVLNADFGKHSKEEVLALQGMADFVVIPSYCEGFGLPLIEANCMGTPVIHCNYPPLNEITCDANLVFDYEKIEYLDRFEGILYEMHKYSPRRLAEKMIEAYDMVAKDEGTYKYLSKKCKEQLNRFNAHKLYSELLQFLETVKEAVNRA